jgi:hypothetical protein
MKPHEILEMSEALDKIRTGYEKYRQFQEQEHAHLSSRGSVAEWNILVRQKQQALQGVLNLSSTFDVYKKAWQALGSERHQPEYAALREKITHLQSLLTRILTCDRMNEVLLYNGGYLQSVVAFRSMRQ